MKRILFILGTCILTTLTSCVKSETESFTADKLNDMEFYAGCVSKTILDGNSVLWQCGDAVSIFDGTYNNKFITDTDGNGAVFSGKARAAETYYAVYPYNADFSLNSGKIRAVIPTIQTAFLDGFAPEMNVSVGMTDDTYLEMKNVCGYVKFRITRSDITSVNIISAGAENIAGNFEISFDSDGIPSCKSTSQSDRKVMMTQSGEPFVPGCYIFCLAPTKLSAGVRFEFTTNDGKIYRKVVSALTAIKRRTPSYVGVIDVDIEEVAPELALDPSTKTTVSPGVTYTNIYLNTNCSGVTATVQQGATLENVSVSKISDSNFTVSFNNPSTGPEDFKTATIKFSANGVADLSVTIRQSSYLILDLSDSSNPYGVPGTADDVERTIVQGGYTFKYSHCKWYKSNNFMFAGTNGGNTYISFPAISGLTLTAVDITYKYFNTSTHKLNGYITLYGDSDTRLTEKVNNELVTEGLKTKHLVLGTGADGVQPLPNTAYQFWSTQAANSLMTQIALTYE